MEQDTRDTAVELVHVGFGNFVAANRALAIVTASSAPINRLIREAKKKGHIIDTTSGRRTKAAVILDTGSIMLIAITPEAVDKRLRAGRIAAALTD